MLSKKISWIRVFDDRDDLFSRFISDHFCVRLTGRELLFVKEGDMAYAFKNRCPHQNKSLAGCKVHEGHVVCPVHQYSFSLEDGRGHGLYLENYPIEYRENGVFVGIEKWSLF